MFEPDYELMPIGELGAFIERNKHLPNVPSADEIREGGVNLQQFQGRLLEKVEELVLYTLEQQETIEQLDETNADLVQRLEALERMAAPGSR